MLATPPAPPMGPRLGHRAGLMTRSERNGKWRIMADQLRWPAATIATLCGVSVRTVELGLKSAYAEAAQGEAQPPPTEPAEHGLSAEEKRDLARLYARSNDPAVIDFLRSNNGRPRRRP